LLVVILIFLIQHVVIYKILACKELFVVDCHRLIGGYSRVLVDIVS